MSVGSRSGVNWMRRKSSDSSRDSAFTSSVLPSPGSPSSSTWPRASSAATTSSIVCSLPRMTGAARSTSRAIFAWPPATRSGRRQRSGRLRSWVGSFGEIFLHGALVARRERAPPRASVRRPRHIAAPPLTCAISGDSLRRARQLDDRRPVVGAARGAGRQRLRLELSNGSVSLPHVSGASPRPRLMPPRPGSPSPSADCPDRAGTPTDRTGRTPCRVARACRCVPWCRRDTWTATRRDRGAPSDRPEACRP